MKSPTILKMKSLTIEEVACSKQNIGDAPTKKRVNKDGTVLTFPTKYYYPPTYHLESRCLSNFLCNYVKLAQPVDLIFLISTSLIEALVFSELKCKSFIQG